MQCEKRVRSYQHTAPLTFLRTPKGTHLALPGKHEVRLMTRDTWSVDTVLKGAHSDFVSVVSYSPNGKYLVR